MRCFSIVLVLTFAPLAVCDAKGLPNQDAKGGSATKEAARKESPTKTPAADNESAESRAQLRSLIDQFQTAERSFLDTVVNANKAGVPRPDAEKSPYKIFAPKFFELAEKNPGTQVGLDALGFVAMRFRLQAGTGTFFSVLIGLYNSTPDSTKIALICVVGLLFVYVLLRVLYRIRKWNFAVVDSLMDLVMIAAAIWLAMCVFWPEGEAGLWLYLLVFVGIGSHVLILKNKIEARDSAKLNPTGEPTPSVKKHSLFVWLGNLSVIGAVIVWCYFALGEQGMTFAMPTAPEAQLARDRIVDGYLDNPRLYQYLDAIDFPSDTKSKTLWLVHERSPVLEAQAYSVYLIADKMRKAGGEEEETRAVELLKRTRDRFAAVHLGNTPYLNMVDALLAEITTFAIGKPAPEIVGPNADGKPMKLSDYKGKVVIISFWGSWCQPCRMLIPYERSIVEKYKDKPFSLIGVASDTPAAFKKALKEENITWPCWNDGPPGGPIVTQWRVQAWPTMHVIDKKGMIRYKNVRNDLESMIDQLIVE